MKGPKSSALHNLSTGLLLVWGVAISTAQEPKPDDTKRGPESWQLQNGQSFQATLQDRVGSNAVFQASNGKDVSVPLSKLIHSDHLRVFEATRRENAVVEGPLRARFVRVQSKRNDHLEIAEVEIFSRDTNLALWSKPSQSSTHNDREPRFAIDGNTAGDAKKPSFSSTNQEANPWWEADLGESRPLTRIVLHARSDRRTKRRMAGYALQLLDEDRKVLHEWKDQPAPMFHSEFTPPITRQEIIDQPPPNPFANLSTDFRDWHTKAGRTVHAKPIAANTTHLRLKTEDGRIATISHNALIHDDIAYVQHLAKGVMAKTVTLEIPNINRAISLSEIQVFSEGINIAPRATVLLKGSPETDPRGAMLTDNILDGNSRNGTVVTSENHFSPGAILTFPEEVLIERIGVWGNQEDPAGLANMRSEFRNAEGTVVFDKDFNPAPSPVLWIPVEREDFEFHGNTRGNLMPLGNQSWSLCNGRTIQGAVTGRDGAMVKLGGGYYRGPSYPLHAFTPNDQQRILGAYPPPEDERPIHRYVPELIVDIRPIAQIELNVWKPTGQRPSFMLLSFGSTANHNGIRRLFMREWRDWARVYNVALVHVKHEGNLGQYQEILNVRPTEYKADPRDDSPYIGSIFLSALTALDRKERLSLSRLPTILHGRGVGADTALRLAASNKLNLKAMIIENPYDLSLLKIRSTLPTLLNNSLGWQMSAQIEEEVEAVRKRGAKVALTHGPTGALHAHETDPILRPWISAIIAPVEGFPACGVSTTSGKIAAWSDQISTNPSVAWLPSKAAADVWVSLQQRFQ